MANRDDDFLARWSRRKVEARGGLRRKETEDDAPAPAPAERARQAETGPATAVPRGSESLPLVDAELSFEEELRREEETPVAAVNNTPVAHIDEFDSLTEEQRAEFADVDFDKLTPDDDFSRFMRKDVPEIIRRRALRALWSHPVISNVDRMNEYDEDYTDAALAIRAIDSDYKPGSSYLNDEERVRYNMMDEDEIPAEVAEARDDDAKTEAGEAERTDGDSEDGDASPTSRDGDAAEVADAREAGSPASQADEKI